MRTICLLFTFIFLSFFAQAQKFQGKVLNMKTHQPIEYVNIGVINKTNGTTSDDKGNYEINLPTIYDNDSLKFSCIGFAPLSTKVSDFKKMENKNIELQEFAYQLKTVVVHPKQFTKKFLGCTASSKRIQVSDSSFGQGHEIGGILKIKKTAFLERVNIKFGYCKLDTIIFRINFYKVKGKLSFENILTKPILVKLAKSQIDENFSFDLHPYNIVVEGDCLVTMEEVRCVGHGQINLCAGVFSKAYFRKVSQGAWDSLPVGIGLNVEAQVEK